MRRRSVLKGGVALGTVMVPPGRASAARGLHEGVTFDIPDLVEDGRYVPVAVAGPPTLRTVSIVAPLNPHPHVLRAAFLTGAPPRLRTRIRLARDQSVQAIFEFADGRSVRLQRRVRVLVGGCHTGSG